MNAGQRLVAHEEIRAGFRRRIDTFGASLAEQVFGPLDPVAVVTMYGHQHTALLDAAWADADQRARSLASLVADGLAEPLPGGCYALPR